MYEAQETTDSKLDQLMESVDLLFARVGDLHHLQQHMQEQVALNTRALNRLVRD